ncbi:iron uptake porin [Synechococcus sp. RS9916]|uniref:iron uptake porin n=1 Tax=Synechococcus sp. RS9916 TaxID=221359 RepID=UPI0002E97FA9|nr:iron uptake porin [Synechococcus sp. RS9916]
MKLFQQLLVAPAALGLLAPVAANAAELNINGVSDYAASGEQVTSISQFSDVYPTDWAYQALSNLIERYGCVAGYPNGTYRGNRAMTRYEAAALLNACLDRITEVTDELKRLMKEFEKELAILKGRVDGLEARVGELEATQFSTTTKLKGKTTFVIGGSSFGGDAYVREQFGRNLFIGSKYGYDNAESFSYTDVNGKEKTFDNPFYYSGSKKVYKGRKMADVANQYLGAVTFNYDQQLDFLTSFTGKDLLKVKLRGGNFGPSAFGGASTGIPSFLGGQYSTQSTLETAFEGGATNNNVVLNRVFYQFPLGENFTVTAGGVVRQDDMLAVWPSAYPADTVLDFFTYAGAPGAYNLNLGQGAGIWWQNDGFSVSANYVSNNGNVSKATNGYSADYAVYSNGTDVYTVFQDSQDCTASGGIATDCAGGTGTVQLAYTDDNWGVAAAYNYSSQYASALNPATATPLASNITALGNTNSVGLSAYWSPEESGWMPSISAGWGLNSTSGADNDTYRISKNGGSYSKSKGYTNLFGYDFQSATTQSWSVGLQWTDVFLKGNTAGMAVGQKGFVTALDLSNNKFDFGYGNSNKAEERLVRDGQYAWEWWYMFQVTDNISVTPALFYMSRPLGSATQGVQFNQFGGLLKTTFKF